MDARDFLAGFPHLAPRAAPLEGMQMRGLYLGRGAKPAEVLVVSSAHKPSRTALRDLWMRRQDGRAVPLLVVVLYGDRASVCGPIGEHPPVYEDVDPATLDRICRHALEQPTRHDALRFLWDRLPHLEAALPGIRNEGFLTLHELQQLPRRKPQVFSEATAHAQRLTCLREIDLLAALGFTLERINDRAYRLLAGGHRRAVAVLLNPDDLWELPQSHFSNLSPVSYGLAQAERDNIPYVMLIRDSTLRLHPVRDGVGVAQRGRVDTFVEIDLDLLAPDRAGYLWMLFSAEALCEGGYFEEILARARDHATAVGTRLRQRIYEDVVPDLALALWSARKLAKPSVENLRETYEMALTVLFRLLFIAYAEDKELLPYRTNEAYRSRSLKRLAHELYDIHRKRTPLSAGTSYWDEVRALWCAVDEGRPEWGVPIYDGQLFSSDPAVSPIGAALTRVRLDNRTFVPILQKLLIDEAPGEGFEGPVDFSALGVREFGTIYEGLLENELAIAETDLTTRRVGDRDVYWPVTKPTRRGAEIVVRKGQAYLHDASGARKSTGSYFTKDFAVRHLLDHALEPALDDHLRRLDALDDAAAAEAFFDFRVADIAMGSGHFLVAAIDRIERRLAAYLANRPLPAVRDELDRLRKAAQDVLRHTGQEVEIEDAQLLRRQIARRCIYGVDINPLAVQLARVSIWIHTFVPGLPLSFLDHNLVEGNSIVGIATIEEAAEELERYAGHRVDRGARRYKTESLFGQWVQQLLRAAKAPLERLAHLADANAREIEQARAAFTEAKEAIKPTQALFDILTAARLDEDLAAALRPAANGVSLVETWIENPANILVSREWQRARQVLSDLPPFHFPAAFPEVFLRDPDRAGFDCILGNPPWEKAKVEDKSFWGRHFPGYFSMTQPARERFKRKIVRERPDLAGLLERELAQADLTRDALLSSPSLRFGSGDPDLYVAFAWRFWHLAGPCGRIGVVLPRQVAMGKPPEPVRRAWLENAAECDLTFLLNRDHWVFDDAEPRYTIALVSLSKASDGESKRTVALRGPYASFRAFEEGTSREPLRFPARDVLSWTDTGSIPLLPDEESLEIFTQLRGAPRLDLDDGKSWRARPYRELDAANDKPLMHLAAEQPPGYWPVFKGESFDIWTPDTGTYYAWADPKKVMAHLQQKRLHSARRERSVFAEFSAKWLNDPKTLPCLRPRIAFRDVTRATDTRTVRAALVPGEVFLTHKAPYLLWPRGDEKDEALLLGVLCSIPLDWYARRLVELSLNFYTLSAFPIPRPGRDDPLWQRAVELSGRLAAPDERFAEWAEKVGVEWGPLGDEEKDDMIAELDAVVAHLYGLSERQLVHIFETFHEGWDYTIRLNAVLEHFRRWAGRKE